MVCLVFASSLPATARSEEGHPALYHADGDRELYFLPSGFERLDLLDEEVRASYERMLSLHPGSGCKPSYPVFVTRMPRPQESRTDRRPRSLAEAAELATAIVSGRVVGVTRGFHGTSAGSFVRVLVEAVLSGDSLAVGERFLLFLPVGEAELAGRRFCARISADSPHLPELDDGVLFFAGYHEPRKDFFDLEFPESIVFEPTGGRGLMAAGALAGEPAIQEARTIDELWQRARLGR